MTGVLYTKPEWLALQWAADRLLRKGSHNPESQVAACQVVDLTDRPPVACPTCGQSVGEELAHVS